VTSAFLPCQREKRIIPRRACWRSTHPLFESTPNALGLGSTSPSSLSDTSDVVLEPFPSPPGSDPSGYWH
jgi:hypothetical protein